VVEAVRNGALPEGRLHEAAARVSELAAWASPRPHSDREAGQEAARRALEVEGDPVVGAGTLVLELWPDPTIAAGESHHGLGELAGLETVRLEEGGTVPLHDSARELVVVLRDAHRHPWQQAIVPPGAVVVETGLPEWRPPETRAYVATHGAGRVNLAAAAEVLRGG
jgi:beta-N-acetylhexosaminidase